MQQDNDKALSVKSSEVSKFDWTHSNDLSDMLNKAEIVIQSNLVPFKKREDLIMVWQYAKDIGLSLSQAMTELYAIPGKGGTRVCAGVHIHEGLILASGKGTYEVVEDCVEVRHYKLKGLGSKIMTTEEVMEGVETGLYQVVTFNDFNPDGTLKVEKTGKFLIMEAPIAGFPETFVDKRTTIRFQRPDKGIDALVTYYLHEAGRAGYLEKDNWIRHETAMLYTRCFTKGSKRYFSDILKNLSEISEVAQYSNVPYEYDADGNVTIELNQQPIASNQANSSNADDDPLAVNEYIDEY